MPTDLERLSYEVFPDIVNYFQRFIDSIIYYTNYKVYRYAGSMEVPKWLDKDGFVTSQSCYYKISVTISPVLYTYHIGMYRNTIIEFEPKLFYELLAVSYTSDTVDQISKDPLIPTEFELAGYDYDVLKQCPSVNEYARDRPVGLVPITYIRNSWIARGIEIPIYIYKKLKLLPYYLHDKVRVRYVHSLLPRDLLVKQLAIVTMLKYDIKMRYAFAYAWDDYFHRKQMLATVPNLEAAKEVFIARKPIILEDYTPNILRTV
jgi:hypothetical protein